MISRTIKNTIEKKFHKGKAIILIGPRQVGKTTLIQNIVKDSIHLFLTGDDPETQSLLDTPNLQEIKGLLGNYKIVFIETQRFKNIGITLKMITDHFKDVQLLVTGSSAFELKNLMNEPLTGRKWQYHLYPISWQEFQEDTNYLVAQQQLNMRLVYGMYPEIITNLGNEKELLKNLMESYLYKDILAFFRIKKASVLESLLKALAYQVGQEVSYNELSKILGVDKNTVSSYIDILESSYVIFKLPAYSKNLRSEIKRNQKIYFYDNGIRNAIINDYRPMNSRQDKGALWENFLISERLKLKAYTSDRSQSYFWRTVRQQEIDYIEEDTDQLVAYEFKWQDHKNIKIPKTFTNAYPQATTHIIDRSNFRAFLMTENE